MPTNDAIGSLQRARATFVAERDMHRRKAQEFEEHIEQTDRMIESLKAEQSPPLFVVPPRDTPTIKESVLKVLSDGEPHHFNEFMRELGYRGAVPKDASVRGVVSRMKREKEIISVGLGKYQDARAAQLPIGDNGSSAAEAPHQSPEADAGSKPSVHPAQ